MINPRLKEALYTHVPLGALGWGLRRFAPGKTPFLEPMHQREMIFVHVPKAAGSSLKELLYGGRMGGHRSIAEFAAYDPGRTRHYFKCAFVRNPWDRLYSAYSFLTQGQDTSGRDKRFAQTYLAPFGDFDSFVQALGDPATRAPVMRYDHFRPQSHWICLPGAETHAMDFVGRFETMQADLERLCARLDIFYDPPARSRTSQRGDYRDAYGSVARDVVAEIYARDIALLDYSF